MKPRALMPTITHRVRSFLRSQGAEIVPWSGLDETYAELHAMLRRRREDASLWPPLAQLLREIVAAAADPNAGCLAAPDAELLASWDIDALIRDLRAALPESDPSTTTGEGSATALERFLSTLTAPVLGGFLLLGLVAAGCGGQTDEVTAGAGGTAGLGGLSGAERGGSPGTGGIAGHAGAGYGGTSGRGGSDAGQTLTIQIPDAAAKPDAPACTVDAGNVIARTIASSPQLWDYERKSLCECLVRLNTSWSDGLTELFETGTDAGIAAALEEMIQCCDYGGDLSSDFATVRDLFLDGSLCTIARPYKGVSLPERRPPQR
jgi:hypothetical protein